MSQVAQSAETTNHGQLPTHGFVRLPTILTVFPIGRSTWWAGVKAGRYPAPVKLGARVTAWRVEDIRALLAACASDQDTRQ